MGFIRWLLSLRRVAGGSLPETMTELKGSDPCWCGSAKRYRSCHRREDRRRFRAAGGKKIASSPFT